MNKNFIAGVTLLALSFAPLAHAFTLIRGGTYNKGARPVSEAFQWASPTNVTFVINTNQNFFAGSISPELTSAEYISAFTTAASYWNNLCGSNIAVRVSGTTTATTFANDGQNTVFWDNRTTAQSNIISNTGTLAIANPYTNNATKLLGDCDIVVNGEASGNFAINGNSTDYDLVGVLTHEIGHCLGLDHTIESPTYTSSNPILTTATMSSAVTFGDTSFRSLSQDEIDAMECVNSSTLGARNGKYCTSYHGSNGGAALTGVISGGPSAERVCGAGTSSAVTTSTKSGGGCVSKAIAADGSESPEPFSLGWMFLGSLFFLGKFLYQRLRRALLILPIALSLLGGSEAKAAFELAYQYTSAKPTLVNTASDLTSYEGTFTATEAKPASTFSKFGDLYAAFSYRDGPNSTLGLFFKSNLKKEIELKGYNSGALTLTKTNSIEGWLLGVAGKWFYSPVETRDLNFFFEWQVGFGKSTYKQSLLESTGTLSSLEASAFAAELNAFLGGQIPISGSLDFVLKGGYSRLQTNYFTVKSKSGSRYSAAVVENRMTIQSTGEEVRLSRAGVSAQAGLSLAF